MTWFPDIEEGKLMEETKAPDLYTPPKRVHAIDFEVDGMMPDKKKVKVLPTMDDIHECIPNGEMECVTCARIMLV